MTQNEVIAHMRKTLDWTAKEYGKYEDEEVKADVAKEFRIEAVAYNTLLTDMFKRIKSHQKFTTRINTYIVERELENWK